MEKSCSANSVAISFQIRTVILDTVDIENTIIICIEINTAIRCPKTGILHVSSLMKADAFSHLEILLPVLA